VAAAVGAGFGTFVPTTSPFSQSKTNVGWTLGGGLEGRFLGWLSPNRTWKLEYLYVDLGWVDNSTPFAVSNNAGSDISPVAGTVRTKTHFTDIVRVGVNYHWGAQVVANY
jgi:opacity protein-like surface antigen